MTLATSYRDVLELIHVLSYVGVSQTRCAIPDPADRLLPQWHPSDGSDLLTLPDGVPDPLLRACLFSVSAADASRRWGSESLDVDAVLSYLRDRQWIACGRADVPIVAAFRNPLDREEVITTIAVETAEGRTAYIWKTPGGWYVLDRRSGRLTSAPYQVYSLTPEGHRLLEEGADPACAGEPTSGTGSSTIVGARSDQGVREELADNEGRSRANLPRRAQKAGEQYRHVIESAGVTGMPDREAFDRLAAAMQASGEQSELPTFATWQRNLRSYRQFTGQQKNKPRGGRGRNARSVVRADQIESKPPTDGASPHS